MSSTPQVDRRPVAVRTALVVDPEPEVNSILRKALKRGEWDIVHAPDNRTVLYMAEAKSYDLIVTAAKTTAKEDVDLLRKIRSGLRDSQMDQRYRPL
jgi:DNA-binding response OmpR family regulator